MDHPIPSPNEAYDLRILTHPSTKPLADAVSRFSTNTTPINLGALLSSAPSTSRPERNFQKQIDQAVSTASQPRCLLYAIDILFEPSFSLDPLSILQRTAKTKPIIVLWPGKYSQPTLSYAIPSHAHYRVWQLTPTELKNPLTLIQNL